MPVVLCANWESAKEQWLTVGKSDCIICITVWKKLVHSCWQCQRHEFYVSNLDIHAIDIAASEADPIELLVHHQLGVLQLPVHGHRAVGRGRALPEDVVKTTLHGLGLVTEKLGKYSQ